jgi:surface polysaccharide O-acyltransferase-like enzyme
VLDRRFYSPVIRPVILAFSCQNDHDLVIELSYGYAILAVYIFNSLIIKNNYDGTLLADIAILTFKQEYKRWNGEQLKESLSISMPGFFTVIYFIQGGFQTFLKRACF